MTGRERIGRILQHRPAVCGHEAMLIGAIDDPDRIRDMVETYAKLIVALQVIEVKAGMDLLRIHRGWGRRIALVVGIDVRALYCNYRTVIDAELEATIPILKEGFGYVLHSDHSIPGTVDYETYRYFIERRLELGRYPAFRSGPAARIVNHRLADEWARG